MRFFLKSLPLLKNVSKEVAEDLVAKLNAAGGVAVIEEVDEEKE